MWDEQPLRGLFSELNAVNDYRNDALADYSGIACNSWLYWVNSCTSQRRECSVSLSSTTCNSTVQPLLQVVVSRVTSAIFSLGYNKSAQKCCPCSSAEETVNFRVPGSPFIWCWSSRYYSNRCCSLHKVPRGTVVQTWHAAALSKVPMRKQKGHSNYRAALSTTHKMKKIWSLFPCVITQNSSWLIRAP